MVRFGINATGNIIGTFAVCCKEAAGAEAAAISSRELARAQTAAQWLDIPRAFGSYGDMLACPDVDAVYVATPHNFHHQNILDALRAGKHVLSEKPMVLTAAHAREVFAEAKARGLFVMEAMWPRFMELYRRVREMVADGRIGRLNYIDASFCGVAGPNAPRRLTDKSLAGGALYDVGVYCLEMAAFFAGENPQECCGLATMMHTGVDANNAVLLSFPSGTLALLRSSFDAEAPNIITLYGSAGRIVLGPFPRAEWAEIYAPDGTLAERLDIPAPFHFQGEIEEAVRCIEAGRIESDIMPHADTIACAELFDQLAAGWGL